MTGFEQEVIDRLARIETHLDKLPTRIDRLEERVDAAHTTLGVLRWVVGGFAAVIVWLNQAGLTAWLGGLHPPGPEG